MTDVSLWLKKIAEHCNSKTSAKVGWSNRVSPLGNSHNVYVLSASCFAFLYRPPRNLSLPVFQHSALQACRYI